MLVHIQHGVHQLQELSHGVLPAFLGSMEGLSEQQQLSLIEQYKIVEVGVVTWAWLAQIVKHSYNGKMHVQKSIILKLLTVKIQVFCLFVQDLPSFVQNLYQFTSDLRYYLLINTSLPANSVKLS